MTTAIKFNKVTIIISVIVIAILTAYILNGNLVANIITYTI
jgi:hypothetical protein